MGIHRLLYRSNVNVASATQGGRHQVTDIVRLSAERNAAASITGALMLTRGVFVQVLEGPLAAVEATFERICCDLRHRRIELIELVEAEERTFGPWAMVRIPVDSVAEQLVPCLLAESEQAIETVSAQSTIRLMRSILLNDMKPKFYMQTPASLHKSI